MAEAERRPQRIQRRRTAGWRMPPSTRYVGRPGPFGNPFPWRGDWIVWAAVAAGYRADQAGRKAAVVAFYRSWLLNSPVRQGPGFGGIQDCIQYESGVVLTTEEAARGIAATMAGVLIGRGKVRVPAPPPLERIRAELRGFDLACWCPLDAPCHADVLLELANAEAP